MSADGDLASLLTKVDLNVVAGGSSLIEQIKLATAEVNPDRLKPIVQLFIKRQKMVVVIEPSRTHSSHADRLADTCRGNHEPTNQGSGQSYRGYERVEVKAGAP